MHVDMQEIQAFFFEAMLQGWVNPNAHAEPIPGSPFFQGFAYQKNGLLLRDVFTANSDTGRSTGCTTISLEGKPLWMMQYGGWYEVSAVKAVKQALSRAYQEAQFYGGRGKDGHLCSFDGTTMIYKNTMYRYEFDDFSGYECVDNEARTYCHGYHSYFGMILV